MRYTSFKPLLAALAAALSCAAHASGPGYTFTDGSGILTFTSNSLAALNTAGVTVTAAAPASFDGSKITMTSDDAHVVWNDKFDIQSMTGYGGFTLTSSTTKGAQVVLTNIQLDPTAAIVYADAVTSSFSNSFGAYQGKTISHMALFSGNLVGSSNIVASGGNVNTAIQNLALSSVSIPELGNALGVPTFIQQALFPSINFGQIALVGTFKPTVAVPEPSTYALMGIGLVGLTLTQRRRARK